MKFCDALSSLPPETLAAFRKAWLDACTLKPMGQPKTAWIGEWDQGDLGFCPQKKPEPEDS